MPEFLKISIYVLTYVSSYFHYQSVALSIMLCWNSVHYECADCQIGCVHSDTLVAVVAVYHETFVGI